MSDNPSAFPRTGEGVGNPAYDEPGMSLRDWFAGQALVGRVTQGFSADAVSHARVAYQIADAMLAARKDAPHA